MSIDFEKYKIEMEPANEALFFTKDDMEFNLDKWKREPGKNVLYVTGFSGSGKTTLGEKYESDQPNTYILELDGLVHLPRYDSTNLNIINDFLTEYNKYARMLGKHPWSQKDYEQLFSDLATFLGERYSDKLFVLEGIQVYMWLRPEYLKDKPLVIKGTSAILSLNRRLNREKKRGNPDKTSFAMFKAFAHWYLEGNAKISKLNKKMSKFQKE